jgi:hypothetical protein
MLFLRPVYINQEVVDVGNNVYIEEVLKQVINITLLRRGCIR